MTPAAIAADAPGTADAAMRIAEEGGNVVDMAVAAALAATVAENLMGSLGGSAFLMVRRAGGRPELVEGGDVMPRVGAAPDPAGEAPRWRRVHLPYGDGIEVVAGHASVAVPGMLRGLELAWRRHGSLPWRELVAPAIDVAKAPCPVSPTLWRWLAIAGRAVFYEQEASRRCFFPDGENALGEGDRYRIPHMAETLELIADEGADALYRGDLGAMFAREMRDNGGFVTREDLEAYRARVRDPLRVRSGGFELALNPPPAVGGAALGSLVGLLEAGWERGQTAAERALLHARAQQCLLRVREDELYDAGFDGSRAAVLLAPETLRRHLHKLRSPNTTHFSVAAADGAMAAVTLSNGYGSGITIPGTGIVCNNSLGEPELNPQGYHGSPRGARMVSNMAPTVALHRDGRCLALGSPGASRITTAIAQTWARHAFGGASFEGSVSGARLHVEEWGDGLRAQCEPGVDASLLGEEFVVRPFERPDMFFGAVKLVGLDGRGELRAIADGRREGAVRRAG